MKLFAALFHVFFLFASLAKAEPSETIKALFNQPVSRFEFGLSKLNDTLQSSLKGTIEFYLSPVTLASFTLIVGYDWEQNEIFVLAGASTHDVISPAEFCRGVVSGIKDFFGVDPLGRKLHENSPYLAGYFASAEAMAADIKTLNLELVEIVRIEASVVSRGPKEKPRAARCRSSLMGETTKIN